MSAKGRMAIEGVDCSGGGAELAAGFEIPRTRKYQMMPGAAATTPTAMSNSASWTPLRPVAAAAGGVRSIRPPLTSNTHARVMTMGKQAAKTATTYESTIS